MINLCRQNNQNTMSADRHKHRIAAYTREPYVRSGEKQYAPPEDRTIDPHLFKGVKTKLRGPPVEALEDTSPV